MQALIYALDVEGVGNFKFRRRTGAVDIKIGAEYCRLSEGVAGSTPWFAGVCAAVAALKVLIVEAPEGFSIDMDKLPEHGGFDPLDETAYGRVMRVHQATLEKERFFRAGGGPKRAPAGEAAQ